MTYAAFVPYLSLISCLSSPSVDTSSSRLPENLESTVVSSTSAHAAPQPPAFVPTPAAPDPAYRTKALDLTAAILNGDCHENEPLLPLPYTGRTSPAVVYTPFSVYEDGIFMTALAGAEKSSKTTPSSLYLMLCPVPYTLQELSLGQCDQKVIEIYDHDLDGIPNAGIISTGLPSFSFGYHVYSRTSEQFPDYQLLYQDVLDTVTSACAASLSNVTLFQQQ